MNTNILLGIDPGLTVTGWGVIEKINNELHYVAHGVVKTSSTQDTAQRLAKIYNGIHTVINTYHPTEAAIEKTFVNRCPASSLKLSLARGVAMVVPAIFKIPVSEYAPNKIKKTVVGYGHADKFQIAAMVNVLLKNCNPDIKNDSADALAVAICHANFGTRV